MHHVPANGASIPAIGLGTWQLRGPDCARIVAEGLRIGYRHIDTAQMYDNEREVGAGIRDSGVPRADVFLTTKLWPDSLTPGAVERESEERLRLLGVDAVDLLLIHWPSDAVPLADTLAAMARVKRAGLTRHLGVSNFSPERLDRAVAESPEPLVTNQFEYHPFLDQRALVAATRRHGLAVTAYCPVARGRVLSDPDIQDIAARHGRTPAQVALRWLVQQGGVVPIPKTANSDRLAENLAVFDFALDDGEMAVIAGLADPRGRLVGTG